MNWLRAGILMLSALLASAGSRPTAENNQKIASARAALRQATAKFGPDHPATAMLLSNLALAMREGGYFNYAEHYARQSLEILEKHFGPSDVSLAPPLNVLAEAAVSEGRYDDALAFARRAVEIGPEAGAHYGTALHNLAAVYQVRGQFQQAAEYYAEALAVWEKLLPPGHPYIRLTQTALGKVQRSARLSARR